MQTEQYGWWKPSFPFAMFPLSHSSQEKHRKSWKRQSFSHRTLVGGKPTPLKNMSSSVGIMKCPTVSGKPIQIPWFQTNNQNIIILLLYIPSGNLTWLLKIVHLYGKKNVSNHQPEHIRKSSKVVSFWAKRHVFCHRKQRWKATGAFAPERRPEKPLPLTKKRRKVRGFKLSKEKWGVHHHLPSGKLT